MKSNLLRFLFLSFFLSATVLSSHAQKISQADSIQNLYNAKRAKNFYFELLGPGAIYSVNYDFRFKQQQNGWGGRAGLGFYASDNDRIFTVPLIVNYLAGKKGKYFEVGGGITYYNTRTDDFFFKENYTYFNQDGTVYYANRKSNNGIFGSLNFGYRYQPVDGGFSLRTGFSPIITSSEFVPYWPYLSLGYTF